MATRNSYTRQQSIVIALWVLALQNKNTGNEFEGKGKTAPKVITDVVNSLGPQHTSDSILLHTHGYDRILLGRGIERTITNMQISIAEELLSQGLVQTLHNDGNSA